MEKPKIVFISPPSPFEEIPAMDAPLGLAYLSAYLKSKGYTNIKLVDFNLFQFDYYHNNSYLKKIPLNADIYGITVTTPQFYWHSKIIEYIKENNGNSLVVTGGPHATARPHECLDKTKTDIVVLGEGEETLYELIENPGKPVKGTYSKAFKGCRRIVNNLDSLPFPDRTLINPFLYKRTLHGKRAFHVITARDCPYNCSFCSKKAIGRLIRFRSVENFLSEIDYYISEYGVTRYIIYDDTFTLNKERAVRIAVGLGERGVLWRCFSRTDCVDKRTLKVFKGNGLSSITFGVETFSSKMLKVYNKGTTVQDNKKALLLCRELQIPVRCSLIYGGPYETKKTLQDTINGVKETQPNEWNIATLSPIPGSDIGDNPDKYNIGIHSDSNYLKYHRVGQTGMGEILVDISTMTVEEYKSNRKWFVEQLERVCPRRKIQDTIQTLRMK